MPAEISQISIMGNDVAECAFALKPAWHGLGHVFDHAPTSDEMIEAAHLNWKVKLCPSTYLYNGKHYEAPGHFATVRTDSNIHLANVKGKYQIVQNSQAFSFLDNLLKDGVMRYESAGALRGGRTVWALARMPSIKGDDMVAAGDSLKRYVLFSTTHDGSSRLHAIPTSTRVVCANTYRIAVANDIGYKHSGDMDGKLDEAAELLSQYDQAFTKFRDTARRLAEVKIKGREQATKYIEALFPKPITTGRALTIRENKVQKIRDNYANPRNSMPSIKHTWWAMYNSVSEFVDHQASWKGAGRKRDENRFLNTLDGPGADLKNKAFKAALEFAGVE